MIMYFKDGSIPGHKYGALILLLDDISQLQNFTLYCLVAIFHLQNFTLHCLLASFHLQNFTLYCLVASFHLQNFTLYCLLASFHLQNFTLYCLVVSFHYCWVFSLKLFTEVNIVCLLNINLNLESLVIQCKTSL